MKTSCVQPVTQGKLSNLKRWFRTPAYIASSTKNDKCGEMTGQRKIH